DKLKELIRIAEEHDLEEIEISEGESRMRIRRRTGWVEPVVSAPQVGSRSGTQPAPETVEESKGLVAIESPIVGTFYRASSPDADAYVEVNEDIDVGQVVCVVEAMKLMNEIQSNVAGRVVSVPVGNAEPVEYGQSLFWIDPRESSTARKK
ncbi:MAG: acetyl-CoA carboxylase biotin carboxyl carrier protein, partial [Candidatus Eisenbacteria sp.]|nr:acetyl-CoA carboxylase biotin carboxyl carrier protein [Candidatus Eisenbacteria bacterium]